MNDIISFVFGEELWSSISPEMQVACVIIVLMLLSWLVIRIFRSLNELF